METTTGSPGRSLFTPGPTSATVPAASWPSTTGNGDSDRLPSRTLRSLRHSPLAAICTSTSPSRGAASSTSPTSKCPPGEAWTAAVMCTGYLRSSRRTALNDLHRVAGDAILVEEEAEAWAFWNVHVSLLVDHERLGQHLVARRRGEPAPRVVREFQVAAVGQRRGEMQVNQEAQPVAPGVRNDGHAGQPGELRQLADGRGRLGLQRVRLEHVETAPLEQQLELVQPVIILPAGQPERRQPVTQPCQARIIVPGQRLFQPGHPQP